MIRALVLANLLVALLASGAGPAPAADPLPFDVSGAFQLVDQHGQRRSQIDPDGRAQLLFFGYANCPGICTAALPMMADATDLLAEQGLNIRPVMITVAPLQDKVATLAAPMARLHPDFIGLTGTQAALAQAYKNFSVEHEVAYTDPEFGPIYTHGTFVYLLDGQGNVLTLFPPVLTPERVAGIVAGYIAPKE